MTDSKSTSRKSKPVDEVTEDFVPEATSTKRAFFFPRLERSIEAETLEEAQKIAATFEPAEKIENA